MDLSSLAGDGAGYKVHMEPNHCIKRQSCPSESWRAHTRNADGVGKTKSPTKEETPGSRNSGKAGNHGKESSHSRLPTGGQDHRITGASQREDGERSRAVVGQQILLLQPDSPLALPHALNGTHSKKSTHMPSNIAALASSAVGMTVV